MQRKRRWSSGRRPGFRWIILPVFLITGPWWFDVARDGEFERPGAGAGTSLRSSMGREARFAEVYEFRLRATSRARGAAGVGELLPAHSPFGFALTAEGFPVYDLELNLRGLLPPPPSIPSATYVAWLTTPELDRTEKLGPAEPSGSFTFRVSTMNKFILMVTLEASAVVVERRGPIVLRGISPSGLMQSFASHELFDNMPHDRE